jgi:hypothetical protein
VGVKATAEDAYADMSQPPPEGEKESQNNFVLLRGLRELSDYLYKHDALVVFSLLLAIHRHLDMAAKRGEKTVALTASVWEDAGIPPKEKSTRKTMLAHLQRMPDLVALHEHRTPYSRYRIARGLAWRRMEKGRKK